MRFVDISMSKLVDNLSEIRKHEEENVEYFEYLKSLETYINNYAEIEKKKKRSIHIIYETKNIFNE